MSSRRGQGGKEGISKQGKPIFHEGGWVEILSTLKIDNLTGKGGTSQSAVMGVGILVMTVMFRREGIGKWVHTFTTPIAALWDVPPQLSSFYRFGFAAENLMEFSDNLPSIGGGFGVLDEV